MEAHVPIECHRKLTVALLLAGKTQAMGEIKVALKKETKTEGEQLVVEILQCRNITYKFKSPDHLPGMCPNERFPRGHTSAGGLLHPAILTPL